VTGNAVKADTSGTASGTAVSPLASTWFSPAASMCPRALSSLVSKLQTCTNPWLSECGWDRVAPFALGRAPITLPERQSQQTLEGLKWRSGCTRKSLPLSLTFSKYSRFIYFKLACRQIEPPGLGRSIFYCYVIFPHRFLEMYCVRCFRRFVALLQTCCSAFIDFVASGGHRTLEW
jgi:hypothetical protein